MEVQTHVVDSLLVNNEGSLMAEWTSIFPGLNRDCIISLKNTIHNIVEVFMRSITRKMLLVLLSAIFVLGSAFTISSAASNSANFHLQYTNSSYNNITSVSRDIYVSGAGYDVTVTELSGTATYRSVTVSCPYATGTPYTFTTTGTKHFGYNGAPAGQNYVTFTFTLNYTPNNGTAVARGTVSKC